MDNTRQKNGKTQIVNEELHRLIACIFDQHIDEDTIDCEQCEQHFCRLAELVQAGADVHVLLPEVEHHLACCPECNEEFQALLTMIAAQNSGPQPQGELS